MADEQLHFLPINAQIDEGRCFAAYSKENPEKNPQRISKSTQQLLTAFFSMRSVFGVFTSLQVWISHAHATKRSKICGFFARFPLASIKIVSSCIIRKKIFCDARWVQSILHGFASDWYVWENIRQVLQGIFRVHHKMDKIIS